LFPFQLAMTRRFSVSTSVTTTRHVESVLMVVFPIFVRRQSYRTSPTLIVLNATIGPASIAGFQSLRSASFLPAPKAPTLGADLERELPRHLAGVAAVKCDKLRVGAISHRDDLSHDPARVNSALLCHVSGLS
jgi:hypothetical protein